MLTGKYPFSGRNEVETIYSRIKKKKKSENTEVFSQDAHRLVTQDTVDYVKPPSPVELRSDVPEEISSMVMDMLAYHPVQRPKLTEILAAMNLYIAKKDKEKVVQSAQKEMVTTKTRAIPVMRNLYGDTEKKKKKWNFFK